MAYDPLVICEKILDCTQELYFKVGYHKLCIEEVAENLEISKTTLYKFFPSKKKLVAEVIKRFIKQSEELQKECQLIFFITGLNLFSSIATIIGPLLLIMLIYIFFAAIMSLHIDKFGGAAVGTMISAIIFWFLSGGVSTVRYTTGLLHTIAYCIPNTYALNIIRADIFKYSISNPVFSYIFLIVFTIIMMIIGIITYKKQFCKQQLFYLHGIASPT
jgi:AcrR family transcriptional regulator